MYLPGCGPFGGTVLLRISLPDRAGQRAEKGCDEIVGHFFGGTLRAHIVYGKRIFSVEQAAGAGRFSGERHFGDSVSDQDLCDSGSLSFHTWRLYIETGI